MNCVDCGHVEHAPGRCPFDNCGESAITGGLAIDAEEPNTPEDIQFAWDSCQHNLLYRGRYVMRCRYIGNGLFELMLEDPQRANHYDGQTHRVNAGEIEIEALKP